MLPNKQPHRDPVAKGHRQPQTLYRYHLVVGIWLRLTALLGLLFTDSPTAGTEAVLRYGMQTAVAGC